MTKIQQLEREVKKLNRTGLAAFRSWFTRFDAEAWDRQIQKDARASRLDSMAKQALAAHRSGRTREL